MSDKPKNIEDILSKLTNVKPAGQNKWVADCPVVGHSTPASIYRSKIPASRRWLCVSLPAVTLMLTFVRRWGI